MRTGKKRRQLNQGGFPIGVLSYKEEKWRRRKCMLFSKEKRVQANARGGFVLRRFRRSLRKGSWGGETPTKMLVSL